jgi:hypothetical protein
VLILLSVSFSPHGVLLFLYFLAVGMQSAVTLRERNNIRIATTNREGVEEAVLLALSLFLIRVVAVLFQKESKRALFFSGFAFFVFRLLESTPTV